MTLYPPVIFFGLKVKLFFKIVSIKVFDLNRKGTKIYEMPAGNKTKLKLKQ